MRNGFYRIWYEGSVDGGTVAMLWDGDIIGCDASHTYMGRYSETNGHFEGMLLGRRHLLAGATQKPDEFRLDLTGRCTEETVLAVATIPEVPEFALNVSYVWLCEA